MHFLSYSLLPKKIRHILVKYTFVNMGKGCQISFPSDLREVHRYIIY